MNCGDLRATHASPPRRSGAFARHWLDYASVGATHASPAWVLWLVLLLPTGAFAQPADELEQSADDTVQPADDFELDLGFDDDLFAGAFDDDEEEQEESWLDDFSVRISQQVFGQVNRHTIDLFPGFSFPREPTLENNRLGVNVRYQNLFANGWVLQASAQTRVYWNEDYEYISNGNEIETESRVNEFFVQRSFGAHSVKLGRQTVVWGETVGNSVLDVINIAEFRDFTIIDIEDARLNQFMLVWDYFSESSGSFSTFVNLYPEFNPAPVRGSPFFFDPGYHLPDFDRNEDILFEVGSQWRYSIERSDFALVAAYLIENQVRWEPPLPGSLDGLAKKNDFLLLGFSANRAIGDMLLNFDLAFSHDILANSFSLPGTTGLSIPIDLKKDQIGTSLGLEYAISNEQSLSVGVQAQKLLKPNEGLRPGQQLLSEDVFGNWLLRYSNSMRNGDLVFSSTLFGDLERDSLLAQLGVDFTIDDNWSISSQIVAISGKAPSPLLFFDEDVRLGATISYSF